MRKLATIRRIDALRPIEGADAIECAVVGGWTSVIKKGEYRVGDLAVYCEIDSWIPHSLAPFLSKGKEPRMYDGVLGERLRTIRLRGQLSQGLLLPLEPTCANIESLLFEGLDVSWPLGITKYEAPIPAQLAGEIKGEFPGWIPKTDQERIQNLSAEFAEWKEKAYTWEVTEKLDGSSMTVYTESGDFGICSRNWELRESEGNTLWKTARAADLENKMRKYGGQLALQGELVGEGVQGNPYMIKGHKFYVFDIYDIDAQRYVSPKERKAIIEEMGVDHVPVLHSQTQFLMDETVESLLRVAEGKSVMGNINSPEREGLVFKCNQKELSFKVISNKFLLKGGE